MDSSVLEFDKLSKATKLKLDEIIWKIDAFDKEIIKTEGAGLEQDGVISLLQSVSEVKKDYDSLKHRISVLEDQEKIARDSLVTKVLLLQNNTNMLSTKIYRQNNF